MKIDAEHCVIDFTFYSPEAIVYFQFDPAVAALSSYGAVNLETENEKKKSRKSCKSCQKNLLQIKSV